MIAWLLKKVAAGAEKPTASQRSVAPENCAIWHEVSRALDAKPRDSK